MMMMITRLVLVVYLILAVSLMCYHLKPTDHHHVSSDCRVGYGCIRTETSSSSSSSSSTEVRSRKLLVHNNAEEVFRSFGAILDHHQQLQQQQQDHHDGGNVGGWSLRSVPSGPDPLHHNGAGPKKPQTP